MSQQSVTVLSQPSNELHKPPKSPGGCTRFSLQNPPLPIGKNLKLKVETENHIVNIRNTLLQSGIDYEKNRPTKLIEYHYATMEAGKKEDNLPPKVICAIPGYSGFVPRLESTSINGATFKECSLIASEIFSEEQEAVKIRDSNIKKPESGLTTPETLRQM